MAIDLASFWVGVLVLALIVGAALGGVIMTARFLSGRAIIRFDETDYDEGGGADEPEPQPMNPRIVPKSYPFSRN